MTDPTPELARQLDRDRRAAADAMTPEQRALGGVEMFDVLIDAMRGILRQQNPSLADEAVEQMILDRLRAARLRENSN